jgi:hypothetical protein
MVNTPVPESKSKPQIFLKLAQKGKGLTLACSSSNIPQFSGHAPGNPWAGNREDKCRIPFGFQQFFKYCRRSKRQEFEKNPLMEF